MHAFPNYGPLPWGEAAQPNGCFTHVKRLLLQPKPGWGRAEYARRLPAALYYGTAPVMSDNRPVYLRLRDEIAAAIIDGRYAEGEMLPSVRRTGGGAGANPLTVAKAYQQFQADGLIRVQRGVGMFVREGAAEQLRATERAGLPRSGVAAGARSHGAPGNRTGRTVRQRLTLPWPRTTGFFLDCARAGSSGKL